MSSDDDRSGMTPVRLFLSKLKNVKRSDGGWVACCPGHPDKQQSLGVDESEPGGKVLLKCFAGCETAAIVSAAGLRMTDLFPADTRLRVVSGDRPPRQSLTLAELAKHKQLPVEHLEALGWRDGDYFGAPCVVIPYVRRDGTIHRERMRLALSAKDGTRWGTGSGQVAYEPDRGALAEQAHYLIVVEGETDVATCLLAGLPVLGLPGASAVKALEPHHLAGVTCVFVVQEPGAAGEALPGAIAKRAKELEFAGPVYPLVMPNAAKDPSNLYQRDAAKFLELMHGAMIEAAKPPAGPIVWRDDTEIFAPLPPTKWLVGALQLCPGRPAMIAGYGASAKTLSAQELALAVASGTPAWGHFETKQGQVRHLDYEQGWHATARRYQRLAIGHDIDPRSVAGRLKVAVFPGVYLDSVDAVDAYSRISEGVDLIILDALRGATPSHDENDSKVRACIDNLARVSEKTGTAFVVLHHAGKPKEGHSDARTVLRGSSAIFDACGCILVLAQGATKEAPRKVTQVKVPAESEGAGLDDFTLLVEDVPGPGDPVAGVRVVYQPIVQHDPQAQRDDTRNHDFGRLLDAIRARPGASQVRIIEASGMNRTKAIMLLQILAEDGLVSVVEGKHGAKQFYPEVK